MQIPQPINDDIAALQVAISDQGDALAEKQATDADLAAAQAAASANNATYADKVKATQQAMQKLSGDVNNLGNLIAAAPAPATSHAKKK
jgi:septal ring factor EnvC (AmiA/AmiB activator)